MEYLYDKVNKKKARISWWRQNDGTFWIDTDPYGCDMSGRIRIKCLKFPHYQYEIKEEPKAYDI